MQNLKVFSVCLLTGKKYLLPEDVHVNIYNVVIRAIHFNETVTCTDNTIFDVVENGLKELSLKNPNYRFIYLAAQGDSVWCFDRTLKLINPSTLRD